MSVLKSWLVKSFAVAVPLASVGLVVYATAAPPTPPAVAPSPTEAAQPTTPGSTEAQKETPHSFFDQVTGRQCTIFESVHEPKRYYISPIVHLVPWDDKGTMYIDHPVSGAYEYNLRLCLYHSRLEAQAIETLKNANPPITVGHVSPMVISGIGFTVPCFPEATITPWGELGTRLQLGLAPGVVTVRVPESRNRDFLTALKNDKVGPRLDAKCYYNAIDLKRAHLQWDAADIRKTKAFTDFNSAGAEYVTAGQVKEMFLEVRQSERFIEYADNPWLAETLNKRADAFYSRVIEKGREQHIRTVEEAVALNQRALKGSGLEPKNYEPIVTMYKFLVATRNVTDYHEANRHAKETIKNTGNKVGGKLGFSYGPFSIGMGASRNWGSTEKEFFASQKEYDEFRSEYATKEGEGVMIVGRGLKLVEKGTFDAQLSTAASHVILQPTHLATSLTITQNAGTNEPLQKELVAKKAALVKELTDIRADLKKEIDLLAAIPDWWDSKPPGTDASVDTAATIVLRNARFDAWQGMDKVEAHRADIAKRRKDGIKLVRQLEQKLAATQAELDLVNVQLARRLW